MLSVLDLLKQTKPSGELLTAQILRVSPWEEQQANWKGELDERYWWRRLMAAEYYKQLFDLY